ELKGIRTGRASPALVEHLSVMYYDTPTPLKAIASISVPEATQLLIKPFSPQDIKAIEKAINDSKIGLTPHSDGRQIRLMLPPLTCFTFRSSRFRLLRTPPAPGGCRAGTGSAATWRRCRRRGRGRAWRSNPIRI